MDDADASKRKPCRRCGGPKGSGERRWYCDTCRPLAVAEKRARDNAASRMWLAAHPDLRRQYEARARAKPAHKERMRRATREWREANPERVAANRRRWREDNRERWNALGQRWRALRLDAFVDDVHPLILLEMDDGVCGICGEDVDPLNFHVDHVVPLSKGGEHSYRNTQVAHPVCNSRKGAQIEI